MTSNPDCVFKSLESSTDLSIKNDLVKNEPIFHFYIKITLKQQLTSSDVITHKLVQKYLCLHSVTRL